MVQLIAKAAYAYGTRALVAGDRFDAEEAHAKALVHLGRAELAPKPAPAVATSLAVADQLQSEQAATSDQPKPAAGKYKRRDMRAAD